MNVPCGRRWTERVVVGFLGAAALSLGATGCGSGGAPSASSSTGPSVTATARTSSAATGTAALPGTGKPQITVGDKNFTEQFVLGELYKQALQARGYNVFLNRNIGPTEVTIPAVKSGRVDVYPEYLSVWNTSVAGDGRRFATEHEAYFAGQRYAQAEGLQLLTPTPFSDTTAIAVTRPYAETNELDELPDLRRVAATLTLGAPPQFQQDPAGLPALQQAYGFAPVSFATLAVGAQYQALDQGKVQAADVSTTDGQLASGRYKLLRDPLRVFGWGNVVPVVSARAIAAEGPAFADTIDRVDALLSTPVMRRLNAGVDIYGQTPAAVAKQFLQEHGLAGATGG